MIGLKRKRELGASGGKQEAHGMLEEQRLVRWAKTTWALDRWANGGWADDGCVAICWAEGNWAADYWVATGWPGFPLVRLGCCGGPTGAGLP